MPFFENHNAFPRCLTAVSSHLLRAVPAPAHCSDFATAKPNSFSKFRGEFVHQNGLAAVLSVAHNESGLCACTAHSGHFAQAQVHVQEVSSQHTSHTPVFKFTDISL